MRAKDIEKIISREGDELLRAKRSGILSACGVKESKVTSKTVKTARPSLVRTLAIAAAIMLLAAGMIAALPLLRTNPELPPDPTTDPVIGESTTEEIQGTGDEVSIESTNTGHINEYPAVWITQSIAPYAIIEIVDKTDEIYYSNWDYNEKDYAYRKIKCKVIYSVNTSAYYDIDDEAFKKTEYIYVPEAKIDDFMQEKTVFFIIKRIYLSRQGYVFTIPHDSKGNCIYSSFAEGKLVYNDSDEKNFILFSSVNSQIKNYEILGEGGDEVAKLFPKKPFSDGMTVNEFINNIDAIIKAREKIEEINKALPGHINY